MSVTCQLESTFCERDLPHKLLMENDTMLYNRKFRTCPCLSNVCMSLQENGIAKNYQNGKGLRPEYSALSWKMYTDRTWFLKTLLCTQPNLQKWATHMRWISTFRCQGTFETDTYWFNVKWLPTPTSPSKIHEKYTFSFCHGYEVGEIHYYISSKCVLATCRNIYISEVISFDHFCLCLLHIHLIEVICLNVHYISQNLLHCSWNLHSSNKVDCYCFFTSSSYNSYAFIKHILFSLFYHFVFPFIIVLGKNLQFISHFCYQSI